MMEARDRAPCDSGEKSCAEGLQSGRGRESLLFQEPHLRKYPQKLFSRLEERREKQQNRGRALGSRAHA